MSCIPARLGEPEWTIRREKERQEFECETQLCSCPVTSSELYFE